MTLKGQIFTIHENKKNSLYRLPVGIFIADTEGYSRLAEIKKELGIYVWLVFDLM